jgi:hypothetical protein
MYSVWFVGGSVRGYMWFGGMRCIWCGFTVWVCMWFVGRWRGDVVWTGCVCLWFVERVIRDVDVCEVGCGEHCPIVGISDNGISSVILPSVAAMGTGLGLSSHFQSSSVVRSPSYSRTSHALLNCADGAQPVY